jgi:hypothetical protein
MKNRANTHDTQMRTHGIYYMYSCEQICVGCRCRAKFIGARLRTFFTLLVQYLYTAYAYMKDGNRLNAKHAEIEIYEH